MIIIVFNLQEVYLFQAFIVLACIVAVAMADGPGGHAHAHAPETAPAFVEEPDVAADAPVPVAIPIQAAPLPIVRAAPAPYRPAPSPPAYAPAPAPVPVPAYGPAPVVYQDTPPAYDFAYGVQGDAYTGNAQFAHNENRNGYTTNGEYRVALPDGRTQIVTYNVLDATAGFVADVKYEGQPIPYVAPAPRPAYGSAPVVPVAVPAK